MERIFLAENMPAILLCNCLEKMVLRIGDCLERLTPQYDPSSPSEGTKGKKGTTPQAKKRKRRKKEEDDFPAEEEEEEWDEEEEEEEEKPKKRKKKDGEDTSYLTKRIGKSKLLTKDEEVAICKRIEAARKELHAILKEFGMAPRFYLDVILDLQEGLRRFDQVVQDRDNREAYLEDLEDLVEEVKEADGEAARLFRIYYELPTDQTDKRYKAARNKAYEMCKRFLFCDRIIMELINWVKERYAGLAEKPEAHSEAFALEHRACYEDLCKTYEDFMRRYERLGKEKEKMILSNLRLVISIARKYMSRGLPLNDLIQEGNLGLMKAIDKFEWQRGFKFSTYATWWIKQSITAALSEKSRTIRIPAHMMDCVNKVQRATKELLQENGREPTSFQIGEKIGFTAEKVEEVLRLSQRPVSIHTHVGESDDSSLEDFIQDENAEDPSEHAAKVFLRENLAAILGDMSERERSIVVQRFGLDGNPARTLEELGLQFKVTRERIRQIEAKAIRKMRHPAILKKISGFL